MVDNRTVEEEARYHTYSGNDIPWYIRLIWILFWIFVIYYGISYFLPAIDSELLSPP
ncbi:hypothetical protein [Thalassoglobus polymorphus]|uniref:Uncharacterized protein n=1 Tax=Thalassoglobus polymorphus TaxID=2527994 RepID=A0A517QMM0_9PLAN|nr:hypothetical protein [Thalassoglobus polymorphus]QDT32889.1 hypothetical protein Mal48_21370 [Thalassoglobus polymorphus]